MSRLRLIAICLLSVVLVAAQIATAVQASTMAAGQPPVAAEAAMVAGADEMPGDCEDCGSGQADRALCPVNCCASCSTVAAVLPDPPIEHPGAGAARGQQPALLSPGLSPSPHLTPPKRTVLS